MANTANSTLTTNFNVTPYYDDYKIDKEYYRILFKPGYSVQARELTQMQTMLQSQIKRFGANIFKEGSIVIPGQFTFRVNVGAKKGSPVDYVKIKTNNATGGVINVASFLGKTITGANTSVTAQVTHVLDSDGTAANTKTLYVTYLGASPANSQIRKFEAGEPLINAISGLCYVNNANTNPIGYGSAFGIDEGVLFAKDHFIHFPRQEVIISRYTGSPTCKVGFYITEEIVSAGSDTSLLDPALEASNYAAPGADRLRLYADLTVVDFNYEEDTNFITLFTMEEGLLRISNERTQYNILGDTMAGRTYDESGDYVIRGYNVQVSEHDRVAIPVSNNGKYANGNNQLLIVSVDPGHGYVKGYAVTNFDKYDINIPKGLSYQNVDQQILSTTMGSYVTVNELVGSWRTDFGTTISLYDQPARRINNGGESDTIKWSNGSQPGTLIGTAKFNTIEYVSGVPGFNATYNIYLSDIRMNAGRAFVNVRSLYINNAAGTADAGADIVLASTGPNVGNAVLQGQQNAPLLFFAGSKSVKTVRNPDGTPSVDYQFRKTDGFTSALTVDSSGTLTINLSGPTNETFPYGSTTLSATDIRQDIDLVCCEDINIGPLWTGTSGTVVGSDRTLTGTGTYFTRLNVGDKLEITGVSNTFYISSITNDNILTLSTPVPSNSGNSCITGNTVFKAYKVGDHVTLTGVGLDAGAQRTVTATPTSLSIDLKETFSQDVSATLTYNVYAANSTEATKTLRASRIVKISCASAGTIGPYYLGFSDIYRIRKVVKSSGAAPSTMSSGTDVTTYFTLNNGQTDTHYDIGFMAKRDGLSLNSNDFLMVELDYFYPNYSGRGGFFTIDSYPIQDNDDLFNANTNIRTENVPVYLSNGTTKYDLRNHIDFRPVKTNTAADTTDPASATTNPSASSSTYIVPGSGLKFPVASSDLTFNYSQYLGRTDIVVVTKDNTIGVIRGLPAVIPVMPDPLPTQMMIATIDVTPYPSLSPFFASKLGRQDLSCSVTRTLTRGWTMKDIGGLEKRIQNLEYYASLTLLEKDAVNLKVLDENGNERFKNGLFVDTFKDSGLSARDTNPDYRIVNDPVELSIRPLYSTESIPYKVYSLESGLVVRDNMVMFNYTSDLFFNQQKVTDYRNLERGTYLFQGQLTLSPSQDVWIDTTQLPDETVAFNVNGATMTVTDIVGDTLTLASANNPITVTGANVRFTSTGVNNESFLANTTITTARPNTRAGAVAYTNYWARGKTSNSIVKIIKANYINGLLNNIVLDTVPHNFSNFITNEEVDIWKSLDFGYPPIGTSQYPYTYNGNPDYTKSANGYTGISFQASLIKRNFDNRVILGTKVLGATTGANGTVSLANYQDGVLYTVQIQSGNSIAFQSGEKINFYYSGNNAYQGITGTVSTTTPTYSEYIMSGDLVKNLSSQITGTVVDATYTATGVLTAVSVSTNTNFGTGKVNFYHANNTPKANVVATVTAVGAATPPDPTAAPVVTKSLTNTVWEQWKANVTGYRLYVGSGSNKQLVKNPNGGGTTFNTEAEARAVAASWTSKQTGGVATLETLYTNSREGRNYFAQSNSGSAVGPNKLISQETIPYIRPQVITVRGQGLKPYSNISVWFDGVKVNGYCTPLTENQYDQSLNRIPISPDPTKYANTANVQIGVNQYTNIITTFITPGAGDLPTQGAPLIVRNDGNLYFRFQIGAGANDPKFRTGSRRLFLMDNSQANVIDIEDEEDATTLASNYFFADGTKQTQQRTVYSTKGYLLTSEAATPDRFESTTQIVLPNTWSPPPPPKGHCCFDPDAKVLMADLTWKRIEDVQEGDRVVGDNGIINTVLKNKATQVSGRGMMQFKGSSFWTTDDHLFLTKSGWKTWDPQHVINDEHTSNDVFLVGKNKEESINHNDFMKMVDIINGEVVDKFVPYADIPAVRQEFDPNYIVHDLTLDGNMTYIVEGFVVHNCCIAYSVLINAPQSEEGIFCTGFDVFVQRKSTTRKLWFEVREMDSGGQVTNSQIPGSVVYIENANIPVSTNGLDNPTQVRFNAPIFLMNNKEYAFVVHSFSPSYLEVDPDTYMWISRMGEKDINTNVSVSNRMKTGTFFQTVNNRQWEPIADVDLAFRLYRAKFTPGIKNAIIGNKPVEKFFLSTVSSPLTNLIGDYFSTGDRLTLASANGIFAVGNFVRGRTSGANGTILSVSSNQIVVSNTYYRLNEVVDAYNGSTYRQISATVTALANNTAILSYYDGTSGTPYIELTDSTGGFTVGQTIVDTTTGPTYSAKISSIENFGYSAVSFEPQILDFLKTDFQYEMATVANNTASLGSWTTIPYSETYYWPEQKVVYSRSDEINALGSSPSQQVRVRMSTSSEYVTPVLDLDTTHTIIINNIINSDTAGETNKSGGNALNKYISQTVTLADGQDAEDMRVYLTAYRPPGTDVKVYMKVKNADDAETFEQKYWVELQKEGTSENMYSSVTNRLNFKDYTYVIPNDKKTGPLGEYQYTVDTTTYTNYKYFAIKIALTANNLAVVPRVADLRVMALQI